MEKILGVRYADCTGKNFGEIVDNLDNLVCLASLTSQLHRADEAGCLISLRVSGGTTSTYCANIQDWTDAKGGSIGRVITFLDQTEKQKAEQLRLHFLSVVAHELRTPTTVIRNYLPIVSNESNKEIIGDMESATRRLERVVFNLVSLTKFSDVSAHAQKNVVNIFDISAARIKELQKDADAKPVLINLVNNMHSPLVNTDADIVGIALSNLIDNAIKFNSQLGSIQVILNDLSTLHEPGFSITVTDTGPGICGRARAHLFHCFSQGEHHLNRFYGGMGTGLFLVKRAAELLGGSIALDWTSNAGSSFTLSIPACEADHITQPPSAANPVS